jgi:hypothetical protein
LDDIATSVTTLLDEVQAMLFKRASEKRAALWHKEATLASITKSMSEKNGFYQTGWCRSTECEAPLKGIQATIRCLLEESTFVDCFNCNQPSKGDVLLAKSY